MKSLVRKWGNSPAVRIPAAVMEAARLRLDQAVDVRVEDGRIIIEPIHVPDRDLATLLRGIRPDNLHEPVDFGSPVGREIL